jgi:hypothetical protein
MFRRNRPMRPLRAARQMRRFVRRSGSLQSALVETLGRANHLLEQGKFREAASLFAQLAQSAQMAGHPRKAANLYAQAALAFIDANADAETLNHARKALDFFVELAMDERAANFYSSITSKLRAKNKASIAETLEHEFGGKIDMNASDEPALRKRLPPKCPQCAAPVRSDEVDWIDEASAECAYCGAVVQAND